MISGLIGLVVVGALAGGPAPAGVAQTGGCVDPLYCPQEPAASPELQLRKQCIKKAKKKFANNATKRKAAIKKCKKKYPATV